MRSRSIMKVHPSVRPLVAILMFAFVASMGVMFFQNVENSEAYIANGAAAIGVMGQYDANVMTSYQALFTKGNGSNNGPNRTGFSMAQTAGNVVVDTVHHRLFIGDRSNSRVLIYTLNTDNSLPDQIPDFVLGQPDFNGGSSAKTATGMDSPSGMAYDSTGDRLFVVQNLQNRVLVYNVASISNGQAAVNVLGQATFTTTTANLQNAGNGCTTTPNACGMSGPQSLAYDSVGNRLFVSDSNNNRVLVYNVASISNGQAAVNVFGHPDFVTSTVNQTNAGNGCSTAKNACGMSGPQGLAYDTTGNRLFVGDSTNNRLLIFNIASISNGQAAANELGQPDFTTGGANALNAGNGCNTTRNACNMGNSPSIAYDSTGNRLFVVDTNNSRILVFNVTSISNGQAAVNVLGQSDFTGSVTDALNAGNGCSTTPNACGLSQPSGVTYDSAGNRLFVADTNNSRILIFDVTSIVNGKAAAAVMGQYDSNAMTAPNLLTPVFTKGGFNNGPSLTGFGLSNLGSASNGGTVVDTVHHRLFTGESLNRRILVYTLNADNSLPDPIPDFILGQSDFSGARNFGATAAAVIPGGMAYDSANDRLFVADNGNNRILIFDVASISNNEAAVNVLGQATFTTRTTNLTNAGNGCTTAKNACGMSAPTDVTYDSAGHRLFVADTPNHRVLVFNVSSISNGQAAVNVLGQPDFTTGTVNLTNAGNGCTTTPSACGMNGPKKLAYDSTGNRLFVDDTTNSRVLVFNVSSISNGQAAVNVLGQPDFTTGTANTLNAGNGCSTAKNACGMSSSSAGMTYDSVGNRLFVADTANNRVLVFNVASISNGQAAVNLFGQPTFTTSTTDTLNAGNGCTTAPNACGLNQPVFLHFDSVGNRLFVADSNNGRILIFDTEIDSVPPTISSAVTGDINGNGKIDRIVVPFSEDLDGTTVAGSDFTVTNPSRAIASASETSAGVVTLVLTESGIPDTGATPTVAVVGSISDLVGNAQTSGSVVASDGAAPVLVSVSPADGAVGASDAADIVLTFSEAMNPSFVEGTQFTVSPDPGAFTTAFSVGNTVVTLSHAVAFPNGTLMTVTTNEAQIFAAAGTPSVLLTTGPQDGDWSFTTAPPLVMTPAVTADADGDGQLDQLIVTFSEDLNGATVSAADFSVTSPAFTVLSASETSPGIVTILVAEGTTPDTGETPTVNNVGSISNAAGTSTATSGAVVTTDAAPPILVSAQTADEDSDGKVDAIFAVFSEGLEASSVAGSDFTVTDPSHAVLSSSDAAPGIVELLLTESGAADTGVTPTVTVVGSVTDAHGVLQTSGSVVAAPDAHLLMVFATTADGDGDGKIDRIFATFSEDLDGATVAGSDFAVTSPARSVISASESSAGEVEIVLSENGSPDTDVTPTVTIVGSVANLSGTKTATTGSVSSIDLASPVLLSASYVDPNTNGTVDAIRTVWSEPVTMDGSTDPDWTVTGGSIGAAFSSADDDAFPGASLDLAVSADAGETGGAVNPTVAYDDGDGNASVLDGASNPALTDAAVSVSDAADPVVMAVSPNDDAETFSTSFDIVLTFSEAMSAPFVNGAEYSVSPDPGGLVATFSSGNTVVTLSHSTPFDADTLISVTTDENQIDASSGTPDGLLTSGPEDGDWSFTTAAKTGSGPVTPVIIPAVTVSSPNGGERFTPGDTELITWTTIGRVDLVNVAYSTDGGQTWNDLVRGVVNQSRYSWTIPDTNTSIARVRVEGSDGVTVYAADESNANFTIGNEEPFVPLAPRTCPPYTGTDPAAAGTRPGDPGSSGNPYPVVIPGKYMRTVDDSTVWFITPDLKRHPVVDARTFFTWEETFGVVVYVTPEAVSRAWQGIPVLPRPDTVLITFPGTAAVYALVPDPSDAAAPLLRQIDSEALAIAIYGSHWADYVLDYNPAFFTLFKLGSPVISDEPLRTDLLRTRDDLSRCAGLIHIESRSSPAHHKNPLKSALEWIRRR